MKILICGDIHWSQYSSILRKRGEKYSTRLENLIQSVNWVESTAWKTNCERIVYLGDFFDKPELNAEEISALKECSWSSLDHDFLVGNHEITRSDLSFNSTNVFQFLKHYKVHNTIDAIECGDCVLIMLPYTFDENRSPLSDVCAEYGYGYTKTVICSHNDLKIAYGQYSSTIGYDVSEIEANCDLFINGHIHNGCTVSNKVINIGNLTGQNFGEDAFAYRHCVMILDTDTLHYDFYENPYALNFYKINDEATLYSKINDLTNAIISVKISEKNFGKVDNLIKESKNILASRICIEREPTPTDTSKYLELHCDDHLTQFKNYILQNMGADETVQYELSKVCE